MRVEELGLGWQFVVALCAETFGANQLSLSGIGLSTSIGFVELAELMT